MTANAPTRVGRFYTSARRHPWVLGKVADWRIPLGPYTPAQIAVAVVGGFLLVKTIAWWSWMGPVPIAAWLLAIWAVRRPKIRGRAPMQAALGWLLLGGQPQGGRIGGRAARDRASHPLLSGFTIEGPPAPAAAGVPSPAAGQRAARSPRASTAAARSSSRRRPEPAAPVGPVSGVQQLLALTAQRGGVR
ncbi:hypothetical protein [Streptomyces sp. MBT53]|uniref:hypothetical protein n=1 Tax=Streptomyces sp. MBT53 TaxID=1488384 RepID=UPI0019122638|nr:hypothetical protein [Streptomyces sp. MBT53]MBK6013524.1 hypothetical protein [Streptomyces sp. MBT53]